MAAEEKKLKAEERRLALEEERIRDAKKAGDRAIMFMNPNTMDETARKYWELTRGEILEASLQNVGGGRGGGGACHWLARSTTYTCYVCGDFESNIVFEVMSFGRTSHV